MSTPTAPAIPAKRGRPGPATLQAVAYVLAHPGLAKYQVARYVGPHGSNNFGDRTVWRAINRGLIENRSTDPNRYALYITDAGRTALAARDT